MVPPSLRFASRSPGPVRSLGSPVDGLLLLLACCWLLAAAESAESASFRRAQISSLLDQALTHPRRSTLPSKRQDTSSPPVQSSQSRPKRLSVAFPDWYFPPLHSPSHATTSAPACPVLSRTHPLPPFRVVSLPRACCAVGRASTAGCLCLVDLPSSNPTLLYPIFSCPLLLRLVLAGMK